MDQPSSDPEDYLHRRERGDLLRCITCGGVDDGKSTLIAQLLAERQTIKEEQPGPPRLRNTLAWASSADLAIIMIDAQKGVRTPARWHTILVSRLGRGQVVAAVNKMDLVGYSQEVFQRIEREYVDFALRLGLEPVTCIPIAAAHGHNVVHASDAMPWYTGPTLLQHLERVPSGGDVPLGPFRMLVQSVNPRNGGLPEYTGIVVAGTVHVGDRVRVVPSGTESHIAGLRMAAEDATEASARQSITLTLSDATDVSPGEVIAAAQAPPHAADQFEATVVWMYERPLLQGRSYLLKVGTKTVSATVLPVKYRLNVDTLEHCAARKLELDEIGVCGLQLSEPIAFEPYADTRDLGSFILIDRRTDVTVGAGLLHFALRRSQNVHWQELDVNKEARAELTVHRPCVVWFTGLSGAGKSTVANLLEKRLYTLRCHTYLLDGDNLRHGLNRDLGFTDVDRVENIRRVAEVARLMVDAGLIVLVSFISPFRAERRMARQLVGKSEFVEVFVDTPLEVAESRDPKGLYRKARRGELKNFTGIDSPYEPPEYAEVRLDTTRLAPFEAVEVILATLKRMGVLGDATSWTCTAENHSQIRTKSSRERTSARLPSALCGGSRSLRESIDGLDIAKGHVETRVVNRWTILVGVAYVCLAPSVAFAYVGPGAGLSAIGGALALILGAIFAVVGFVWYPLKRFLQFLRKPRQAADGAPAGRDSR